jgi:subtilisin-like proprotein convertase family protein
LSARVGKSESQLRRRFACNHTWEIEMKTKKNQKRVTRLDAESLGDRVMPAGFVAVGTDVGAVATVRVFADNDDNGTYETLVGAFRPFGDVFSGGARVAMGDFDGDGNDELAVAHGAGGHRVKIFAMNPDGTVGGLIDSFLPFGAFGGGQNIAAGDLDGDGTDELVVAQDSLGNGVRVYSDTDGDGHLGDNQTDSLNPFGAFAGGTRLALADTNNSGGDELIMARGPGGPPTVMVATDSDGDRQVTDNLLLESFLAFAAGYTGGITVAAGAIDSANGGGAEIIVGRQTGTAVVRIFSDADGDGTVGDDALFDVFNPTPGTTTGVRVAAGDTDGSGSLVEVITGAGAGGGSGVQIQDDTADAGSLLSDNAPSDSFSAFPAVYTGGVFVSFGKVREAVYAAADLPRPIVDNTATPSSIIVPPGAGIIKNLIVNLSLNHANNADLDVTLVHVPSGTTVSLFSDVGGNSDGMIVRLSDSAGTDIDDAADPGDGEPIVGTYNLDDAALLSAFDGLDASGEWRLVVLDDTGGGDIGALYSWSLEITY